jgi:hypothetical protein
MKAFLGLGYSLHNVITGDTSTFTLSQTLLSSASQSHPDGSWLIRNRTVYYATSSGLIGVPSWNIFLNNGGLAKYIVKANGADFKQPILSNMVESDARVGP